MHGDYGPWIRVDIGYPTTVSGILTQGGEWYWMTQLKVSTFSTAKSDPEVFIKDENGDDKVICNIFCSLKC